MGWGVYATLHSLVFNAVILIAIKTDEDAILYAMVPKVSTKSTPHNRGVGLDTLKTILQGHKGTLRVLTNNGFVEWDFSIQSDPVVAKSEKYAYHGTLITLRFPDNTLDMDNDSEEDFSW